MAIQRDRIETRDYKFKYPEGLDLNPNSELHRDLMGALNRRMTDSSSARDARALTWKSIDRVLTGYVSLDSEEWSVKTEDSRKPVRVVIPATFATLETLLTFNTEYFWTDPLFGYNPVDSLKDKIKGRLLEMAVNHQSNKFKVQLGMHTMWRDSYAYGIGIGYPAWSKMTYRQVPSGPVTDGGFFSKTVGKMFKQATKVEREEVDYWGNKLVNIDPYNFFPDTSKPIDRIQESQGYSWIDRKNLVDLLEDELNYGFFNIPWVWNMTGGCTSQYYHDQRGQATGISRDKSKTAESDIVDYTYHYMNLVPAIMGMGNSRAPEKWLFVVAGDKYIVYAEKLNFDHGKFPIVVDAPLFDGHSTYPVSILEVIYGLQETADWMHASRLANVRKAINDMFVIDPWGININDIANPKPHKIIRKKRHGYGKPIGDLIQQLNVQDVTTNHIMDISKSLELMDYGSGANDRVRGINRKTAERVTATEVESQMTQSLSRLQKNAKISNMMAYQDIAEIFAYNLMQFMDDQQFFPITEEYQQDIAKTFGPNYSGIRAADININFDVRPKSGGHETDMESLIALSKLYLGDPMLYQKIDTAKWFKHLATEMGIESVNEFIVQPDEQVMNQAEQGNLVPMQSVGGLQ